jgi:hypothetical protein
MKTHYGELNHSLGLISVEGSLAIVGTLSWYRLVRLGSSASVCGVAVFDHISSMPLASVCPSLLLTSFLRFGCGSSSVSRASVAYLLSAEHLWLSKYERNV